MNVLSASLPQKKRRLAIIGGGSSGLISLKYAIDLLPSWDVQCFEQSDRITGVWGNPYPGFVSTTTKYATQFACHPRFDAGVSADGGASREEFFRDGEYGEYLQDFANGFSLSPRISLRTRVVSLRQSDNGWILTLTQLDSSSRADSGRPVGPTETTEEAFDAVILCTGLAAAAKPLDCGVKTLSVADMTRPNGLETVTNQRIVVIGGGESAVDFADRLARPELQNEVYLSLHSGVRVSPRYHPIRGVPSDFLRNRLMLSIHADIRNWIGQRFVEARIRHQERFERAYPSSDTLKRSDEQAAAEIVARRKEWAYKLTKAAKDDLFNMFHNKSDDFLNAVGEQRIRIVGRPIDSDCRRFASFDADGEETIDPDLIVPAIGFRAQLGELSDGAVRVPDFYLGCSHVRHPNLFLVGFARPIIGNIPSISEMQARLVCGYISGEVARPDNVAELHEIDLTQQKKRYRTLDMDAVIPVEMFPYCDRIARLLNAFPSAKSAGSLRKWWRLQITPATTMHYRSDRTASDPASDPAIDTTNDATNDAVARAKVYMPASLILLLLALKPLDWTYRLLRYLGSKRT